MENVLLDLRLPENFKSERYNDLKITIFQNSIKVNSLGIMKIYQCIKLFLKQAEIVYDLHQH